ncbi:MerR family transcriptional regulator [Hamadaea sp. NPDC051192]|uniref:MerR family transcriptional regulator n=1 Tax=Hamadaea sp. NPDC051192 TaxID=3154940 RepID=UPI003414BBD4
MRIGELAATAGVSSRTVDYYTQLGLLAPAERTAKGYRLYEAQAVGLIGAIQTLEQAGLRLESIAGQLRKSTEDLPGIVDRLGQDLRALHQLADTEKATETNAVVAALISRAHDLVTAATELLGALPQI